MAFFDPYEILEIDANADASEVRKAKRRALLNMDLNDGVLDTPNGRSIHKSEFLRLMDQLDDPQKAEVFGRLHKSSVWKSFVAEKTGLDILSSLEFKRIFSSKEAQELIGPTVKERIYTLLKKDYQNKRTDEVAKTTKLKLGDEQQELIFAEFASFLRQDLEQLEAEISNFRRSINAAAVKKTLSNWEAKFTFFKALPTYFQGQRNQLAIALRNFSVLTFNELEELDLALKIIEAASSLPVTGSTSGEIEEAVNDLNEIKEKRQAKEKQESELKIYQEIGKQWDVLIDAISLGSYSNELNRFEKLVNPRVLNAQRTTSIDILRSNLAEAINKAAVLVFNEHSDLEASMRLINLAEQLICARSVQAKIAENKAHLNNIVEEQEKNTKELENAESAYILYTALTTLLHELIDAILEGNYANKLNSFEQAVKPTVLNATRNSTADALRSQLAEAISDAAVYVFNEQEDFGASSRLLKLAEQLIVNQGVKQKIQANRRGLEGKEAERDELFQHMKTAFNTLLSKFRALGPYQEIDQVKVYHILTELLPDELVKNLNKNLSSSKINELMQIFAAMLPYLNGRPETYLKRSMTLLSPNTASSFIAAAFPQRASSSTPSNTNSNILPVASDDVTVKVLKYFFYFFLFIVIIKSCGN